MRCLPAPSLKECRGLWEYGKASETERSKSSQHVAETKVLEQHAIQYHNQLKAIENPKVIYFDGAHFVTAEVREKAYNFINKHLKQ